MSGILYCKNCLEVPEIFKLLSCYHSFCESCCQQLCASDNLISCPLCGQNSTILQNDLILNNLLKGSAPPINELDSTSIVISANISYIHKRRQELKQLKKQLMSNYWETRMKSESYFQSLCHAIQSKQDEWNSSWEQMRSKQLIEIEKHADKLCHLEGIFTYAQQCIQYAYALPETMKNDISIIRPLDQVLITKYTIPFDYPLDLNIRSIEQQIELPSIELRQVLLDDIYLKQQTMNSTQQQIHFFKSNDGSQIEQQEYLIARWSNNNTKVPIKYPAFVTENYENWTMYDVAEWIEFAIDITLPAKLNAKELKIITTKVIDSELTLSIFPDDEYQLKLFLCKRFNVDLEIISAIMQQYKKLIKQCIDLKRFYQYKIIYNKKEYLYEIIYNNNRTNNLKRPITSHSNYIYFDNCLSIDSVKSRILAILCAGEDRALSMTKSYPIHVQLHVCSL